MEIVKRINVYGYFRGLLFFGKFISLLRIVSIRDESSSASLTEDVDDGMKMAFGWIICITSCVKQWYWIQGLSKLNIYFRDWKMLIIIKSINKCGNSTVACQWILIQISTKIAINLWSLIRWWRWWWWWEREQFTLWMF